jgi:hypothetical protein
MNTYAIDFETYYDKETSITTLGTWHYLRHEKADIYMVAIKGPGVEYVGHPKNAPWDKIDGHRWVAHNYAFDGSCIERLHELGITKAKPKEFFCTANLSAYMGAPRNLAGASKQLLGIDMSKDPRAGMKGKTWNEVKDTEQGTAFKLYAAKDAQHCLDLYETFGDRMSAVEKFLSKHTIEAGWHGINVNTQMVDKGLNALDWIRIKAIEHMPWKTDGDYTSDVLSVSGLAKACREAGIEVPPSTSEDDPGCQLWEETYGDKFPWVGAMRDWRKANMLLQKMHMLHRRRRPDGTMPFGLKYFGAHTGRWSGDSKFNLQNLPRDPCFGVDLRACLIPRLGKKFIITDLSQIEPRVLAWLAGNNALLEAVKNGYGIYEAFAISTGMWKGEKGTFKKSKDLYALAKAQVLGLGYGCGSKKFVLIAKLMAGLTITEARSRELVDDYRRKNFKVVELWSKLERGLRESKGEDYHVELPSGRAQKYWDVTPQMGKHGKPDWRASLELGGPKYPLYGGRLCENLVQATARDVFAECVQRLENQGLRVLFHVHDEVILEVDKDVKCKDVDHIMSTTPEWLPGCPIGSESKEAECYEK